MIALPRFSLIAATALLAACHAVQERQVAANARGPARTGVASFYGSEFAGKKTASGEPFRPEAMTAASRTLPLGTQAQVLNLATGQSAVVKINDRGPYAKGRLIDLSQKAARNVGIDEGVGLAQVSVKPVSAVAQPAQ